MSRSSDKNRSKTSSTCDVINDELITDYERDGAVCVRGVFKDWVEPLSLGIERNLKNPGPLAKEYPVASGRFFGDMCNWRLIPEYRSFIEDSDAAAIAAAIMQSSTAQFFHEHVLVKESGTEESTPWHHDMPYYYVDGKKTVSFWLVLDPVAKENSVRIIAGSHRWGKLFIPRKFKDGSSYDYIGSDYASVPDVDAEPDRFKQMSWDLEPGDAIAFHFLSLHGAPNHRMPIRRRAFSTRWLGDDIRFTKRPGITSPPYPGIDLNEGDQLPESWFPVLWRH